MRAATNLGTTSISPRLRSDKDAEVRSNKIHTSFYRWLHVIAFHSVGWPGKLTNHCDSFSANRTIRMIEIATHSLQSLCTSHNSFSLTQRWRVDGRSNSHAFHVPENCNTSKMQVETVETINGRSMLRTLLEMILIASPILTQDCVKLLQFAVGTLAFRATESPFLQSRPSAAWITCLKGQLYPCNSKHTVCQWLWY